jgi:hypothetical protein
MKIARRTRTAFILRTTWWPDESVWPIKTATGLAPLLRLQSRSVLLTTAELMHRPDIQRRS